LSTKVEQRLQRRRDKVRELTVKRHNQRQIAAILKIGVASVNEDLQYMRQQAKQNITKFIDDYLPAEFEFVLDGVSKILVAAWSIARQEDSDKKEQLQALTLAKDCYAMLDLILLIVTTLTLQVIPICGF
jgi:uncharacterized protein YlxP (DUF503 family)